MSDFPSFRLRIALLAYAALWWVTLPLVLVYICYRARRDADYARHLAQRFGHHTAKMHGAVWVHAVSLGEVRSAVPLIRGLLAQGERIVVTHFTPAGRRETEATFAAEIQGGRLHAVWIPFDLGPCLRAFFRAYTPKYGLVMEIEVWPAMIMSARRMGIPLFMCNAQYPLRSYVRDRGGLRAEVMRGFAGALVKSQLQAERFHSVGVTNIAVTGELRFDQPVPQEQIAAGRALSIGRDVVVFASVVEGEDDIFIRIIKTLRDIHDARHEPAPLVVYVPRKPERFDAVAERLAATGLAVQRRTRVFADDLTANVDISSIDILLGDSLGEMYFYLAMATRVVVGGGFTSGGSHNISEPLSLGLPVLTGPDTHTIEYPFVEAQAAGVARAVCDVAALTSALAGPPHATKAQCDAFFAAHSGAAARTLRAIPRLLTTSPKIRRRR